MTRYVRVTGFFFTVMAVVQLTRAALGWPVQIAGTDIPPWISLIAAFITGAFAAWSFRVSKAAI